MKAQGTGASFALAAALTLSMSLHAGPAAADPGPREPGFGAVQSRIVMANGGAEVRERVMNRIAAAVAKQNEMMNAARSNFHGSPMHRPGGLETPDHRPMPPASPSHMGSHHDPHHGPAVEPRPRPDPGPRKEVRRVLAPHVIDGVISAARTMTSFVDRDRTVHSYVSKHAYELRTADAMRLAGEVTQFTVRDTLITDFVRGNRYLGPGDAIQLARKVTQFTARDNMILDFARANARRLSPGDLTALSNEVTQFPLKDQLLQIGLLQ